MLLQKDVLLLTVNKMAFINEEIWPTCDFMLFELDL